MDSILNILKKKSIECTQYTQNDNIIINNNGSDHYLEVRPFLHVPHIVYEDILTNNSLPRYQCCGPILTIVKEFGKHFKFNLKVQETITDPYEVLERSNTGELGDILLMPSDATKYIAYTHGGEKGDGGFIDEYSLTKFISVQDNGLVVAITHKYERSVYFQFQCFDSEVYYAIIGSVIAIAFTMGLKYRSVQTFFANIWVYLSILLSDYMAIDIQKPFDRVMASLWLMANTVILSAFSSQLYTQLIRGQPFDQIDSWDDLYSKPEWNQLGVGFYTFSTMWYFIEGQRDIMGDMWPLASNFEERQIYYNWVPAEYEQGENAVNPTHVKSLIEGKSVFVGEDYILQRVEWELSSRSLRKNIDYHKSKEGLGVQPYFVFTKANLSASLVKQLNFVIGCMFESGIYEEELDQFTQAFSVESYLQESYDFSDISVAHVKSDFLLFSFAQSVALILFAVECLRKRGKPMISESEPTVSEQQVEVNSVSSIFTWQSSSSF